MLLEVTGILQQTFFTMALLIVWHLAKVVPKTQSSAIHNLGAPANSVTLSWVMHTLLSYYSGFKIS